MEKAKPRKEKTDLIEEVMLEDFPAEVLVKIFNFLSNHDIRCGVSLACKRFQKICQDKSLVPVKDLSIKGHYYWSEGQRRYGLRNIGALCDTISQSKMLTTLKIKALNDESIYRLVSTALQDCPKLINLEIIDTFAKKRDYDDFFYKICDSIKSYGGKLEKIDLVLHHREELSNYWIINIGRGCPKLKSLTLESLVLSEALTTCVNPLEKDSDHFITIADVSLDSLSEGCKNLKNLKCTKIIFMDYQGLDYFTKSEVKKVLPNCHVEFKNCVMQSWNGFEWKFTPLDYTISADGEQDSNPEGVNDVLDNFDGGEIEFMFTQNNGEESNKLGKLENRLSHEVKLTQELQFAIKDENSILPKSDVSAEQRKATKSTTTVDYLSGLDILSPGAPVRLSGIVCTIGPASKATDFLVQMIDVGMNVARMNFSHGSYEYHGDTIANCRAAAVKYAEERGYHPSLAIALDTKGPEIRTGFLEGDDGRLELTLEKGASIKITTDDAFKEKCTKETLWVDYKNIPKVLTPGKRIFIDDGLISVVAKEIGPDYVIGEIENGGNLGSKKGCNLPGTDCDLPAVSEKDKNDLLFGVEQGVDMIFASFIRDAQGVKDIRAILGEKGKNILIISKIENLQGVNNIDEIIAESDGIMVARGDMGIEIPPEKVFIAQKQMIAKCNKAGKPIICATQMLESMVKKPRCTRAEGTDVANAVLDGADCVMLSGETAKGDYPLQCIQTMANLSREAESCLWNERFFDDLVKSQRLEDAVMDNTQSIAMAAVQASYSVKAAAIVTLTTSGATAKMCAKYHPRCPIVAVTRFDQVARQLQLHRGVLPLYYTEGRNDDWSKDVDMRVEYGMDFGKKHGFVKSGQTVICVTGWRQGAGASNTIRMLNVE